MNSRVKKFRAKRYKVPTPIPPPKPPRPKISDLKRTYRDLLSSDVDQRVETLKKAIHWHEEAIAYVVYFKALKPHQMKLISDAEKHRIVALNSTKDETKERAFADSIRCYEKVTTKLSPPKVNSYISKFSKVRSVLEKRKRKFNNKFGAFLETVDQMLKPVNYSNHRISLRVDKLSHHYRINSEGNVTFDRKFLDVARRDSRKKGMLVGMLTLFPVLAEAAAMTMEKDAAGHKTGRYVVHGSIKAKAYQAMMENLAQYCLASKKSVRLVRRPKDKLVPSTNVAA